MIAIIGGSGLDDPKILKNAKIIEADTPFGKPSSKLVCGKIQGKDVVILSRHGKNHSIMPTKVPFRANLWALKQAGAECILATTACGSLKEEIKPKELVFIDQFIDFTKHRNLTFFEDKVIHTPMAEPFCLKLRQMLIRSAKKLKIPHHTAGTMITIEGPRFSTRAESRMFQGFGADVINMSTVPEVILARELKICYASIAMATDYDCWKTRPHRYASKLACEVLRAGSEELVTWELILKAMKHNAKNVKKLLLDIIPKIGHRKCLCRE